MPDDESDDIHPSEDAKRLEREVPVPVQENRWNVEEWNPDSDPEPDGLDRTEEPPESHVPGSTDETREA